MTSTFTPNFLPKTFLSGLAILLTLQLQAQLDFNWVVSQGSSVTDFTSSCKLDDQSGLYTAVVFPDTADLDPGPEENMVFAGEDEVFVINKFTQDGEYLWSSQFRGNGEIGGQIAEIRNNRILLIVYFTDSLVYTHHTPWKAERPGPNVAAISMNLEGQIISYHHISDNLDLNFAEFLTQPDGTILCGGSFEGTLRLKSVDSTLTLTSAGGSDAYIARFNEDVELEWITLVAGKGDDITEALYPGPDGKIYYAMFHDSTVVLQTKHGEVVSPALGEDNSIFGWALPDGSIETAYLFGGNLGDQIRHIVVDTESNMYISGYYTGEVNFQHPAGQPVVYTDLGDGEGFIAKYSPDGFLDWARIFTNGDYGGVYTLKIHRNTHLYFSGNYTLISDLDPGPDSLILDGGYDGDLMFGKMSTAGDLEWVYSMKGDSYEGIRNFFPGTDDKVFVHGYYYGDLDCDPGPDSVGLLPLGGSDIMLLGFTEENVITSIDPPAIFDVTAYPNPSSGDIFIQAEVPIEHVTLFDLNGRRIDIPVNYNQNIARISAYELQGGFYLARIKTSIGYSSLKICRQ